MTKQVEGEAAITNQGIMDLQICVPKTFTDDEATAKANELAPTGIESRWTMKHNGHEDLRGCDERVQCSEFKSHVHIMLEC